MWPEGEEPRRYEWREGTMIVPPNMWFHQHFNTGTTPARYLAFKRKGSRSATPRACPRRGSAGALGGDQIDYADERPEVRNGSPKRSPSTASSRAWTRPTRPSG